MSKSQRLEKELDFLKEKYKNYFLMLFALLTGEATVIYAVITGSKPIYALFLSVFGFLFIAVLSVRIKDIEQETYQKLNELEKVT